MLRKGGWGAGRGGCPVKVPDENPWKGWPRQCPIQQHPRLMEPALTAPWPFPGKETYAFRQLPNSVSVCSRRAPSLFFPVLPSSVRVTVRRIDTSLTLQRRPQHSKTKNIKQLHLACATKPCATLEKLQTISSPNSVLPEMSKHTTRKNRVGKQQRLDFGSKSLV